MAMLKILIITQYFWPENFRINDLVLGLHEKGHHVEILTGIPNYPLGKFYNGYTAINKIKEFYNNVIVYRSPMISRGRSVVQLSLNYISFAFLSSLMAFLFLRKKRYDIYFVYEPSPITVGIPALILKYLNKAPIMLWIQDLWPESLSATGAIRAKTALKIVELFVRQLYKRCDRILVQSKAFIPSIVKLDGDLNRIFYYPNSADKLYRPVKVSAGSTERLLMPDGFKVVFAGNIGAAQDFHNILSAAEKLKSKKDIHWIILGDGRMSRSVKKDILKRGLSENFHLLGRFPEETMPRFFAIADVLLVTLKKEPIFTLTIPSKIQSYLACGKPIIAALDGEGAKIIEEAGAGITCSAADPSELSMAVLKMYHMSPEKRYEMGRIGRKYFEKNFERNLLIDRLQILMTETVEEVKKCGFSS